jgi:hypothetical protein
VDRDALYRAYHDDEWGRPVHDDVHLFEKLCLEGFQSGLSWLTILRKREGFRQAFVGFESAEPRRSEGVVPCLVSEAPAPMLHRVEPHRKTARSICAQAAHPMLSGTACSLP